MPENSPEHVNTVQINQAAWVMLMTQARKKNIMISMCMPRHHFQY